MRIDIDVAKCIGAGQCVMAAPEVFDQNEDNGTIILLNDSPPADQGEPVREAAMMCPASVITVVD
ncbi:ferredoxin [Rhodococcus opacus]|jgi:ferredoxin|uniref:ferredoxin n=1 Tax=Rhodococcus opacus TaxID=37919 RepID=UPI0011442362|nr:ferredoxin [Rhodococcus opacus]MDH6293551.1 ferredoxin [Rhodococcus opacus]TQC38906.1 ferredoxin [Rhodococcus sp. WS4]